MSDSVGQEIHRYNSGSGGDNKYIIIMYVDAPEEKK